MSVSVQPRRGLAKYLVDTDIAANALALHVSELSPGKQAHPPHMHNAVEAFYVLEGHAKVELEGAEHTLGPNEVIVLEAGKPHAIANTGDTKLRYLVIVAGR
jgi:mannose-6-phosphate isomerase-like protein (cupin superfamily)